jgi:hypothetical protein
MPGRGGGLKTAPRPDQWAACVVGQGAGVSGRLQGRCNRPELRFRPIFATTGAVKKGGGYFGTYLIRSLADPGAADLHCVWEMSGPLVFNHLQLDISPTQKAA